MELLNSKQDCCGCRTCEKVCPKQAITMIEDECGFLYPYISKEKCIWINDIVKFVKVNILSVYLASVIRSARTSVQNAHKYTKLY